MNFELAVILRVHSKFSVWTVTESGREVSFADFEDKDDAIEFALSLASTAQKSVVEVYGLDGRLESRSEHTENLHMPDSIKKIDA